MKQSLVYKIDRSLTELKNSIKHPGILSAMESSGYTLPRIQEGIGVVNIVSLLNNSCVTKQGEQSGTSKTVKEEFQQVWQRHGLHRKLAQVAYQDDVVKYTQLGLGKLNASLVFRLAYLDNFYKILLEDSSRIMQFGVKKAELTQMQASVQAIMEVRMDHIACKGAAQNATQKRNEAIRNMEVWMSDFRKAARFALRKEPQLLEVLGIMVPTPR